MAKKKVVKQKREFTKKELSQWEKQKLRQRLIFFIFIGVIAAVILAVLSGWYLTQFRPMNQTVLQVNSAKYDMGYLINALKYYSNGKVITPDNVDGTLSSIERNQKAREEAAALGVTVSEAEIDKALKEKKLGGAARDPVRTDLLVQKLRDDYFDKQVPESAVQRQVLAMLLESQSQAEDIARRIGIGEGFGDLAGQLSFEQYTKEKKGDLGWRPEGVIGLLLGNQFLENEVWSAQVGAVTLPLFDAEVSKSVGYWIVRVLERSEDGTQAHVVGILLENQAKAKEVKTKLDAGGNFADLAKEYSQYAGNKDTGGDFGMVGEGTFGTDVDKFIFDTKIEFRTTSEPTRSESFETKGAYWLVKVEASEERKIEGENRDILKFKLLQEWATQLEANTNYQIQTFLTDEQKTFAVEQANKK